MKYTAVWFDADETLFDFSSSEKLAFSKTLAEFGLGKDLSDFYSTYRRESDILWTLLEQGEISKEFLRDERFRRTLATHGVDESVSATEVSYRYLEVLPETCALMDHALELCKELAQKIKIGIITNGFEQIQRQRLQVSGLEPYIDFLLASEACGVAKPDVRFFEKAAALTSNFSKDKVLVVGDRLETDILGAARFGVDSCWYNPGGLTNQLEVKPTFEVAHFSELQKRLLG